MAVRIICINKDGGNHQNPHEGITHYGWKDESNNDQGRSDRESMIGFLEKGGKAYVKDSHNNIVYCYVNKSTTGKKFLQTYSDRTPTDNLLKLSECPIY